MMRLPFVCRGLREQSVYDNIIHSSAKALAFRLLAFSLLIHIYIFFNLFTTNRDSERDNECKKKTF